MNYSIIVSDRPGTRAKIYQAALRLFAERGEDEIAISELAEAAGVARGTIYNNIENPNDLLNVIASASAQEMIARIDATNRGIDDPAARLAIGLRLFVRRAHDEPHWGRFIIRYALSQSALQGMMDGPPARDIARAIEISRFKIDSTKLNALVSMLVGAVLASMHAVVSGHQTWRDAGSDAAELILRAGGISPAEARRLARVELPPLASAPTKMPSLTEGKRN